MRSRPSHDGRELKPAPPGGVTVSGVARRTTGVN